MCCVSHSYSQSDAFCVRAQAIEGCYEIVPAVHRLWRPIRGEYDDYIFNPKPSGYQSLHSAVIGARNPAAAWHSDHLCPHAWSHSLHAGAPFPGT